MLRPENSILFTAALIVFCTATGISAQELVPRAYVITPLNSNAVTLSSSFNSGGIALAGAIPVNGASGRSSVSVVSYYHSFRLFGRSANAVASLPYAVGTFQGTVSGVENHLYRSGLQDSVYRLSVNLKGGPATSAHEFIKWRQKLLLGASLVIAAPTGQYDATKLINWGTNRWSFRPQFGYSERWQGRWVLDGYVGVWLFTKNGEYWSRNSYFAGTRSQTQDPIAAFEGHLSYDVKPRLWVSLDGNFWFGGKTSVNGNQNALTRESNSRLGSTVSVPITRYQSLKFSYNDGIYVRFGGNYNTVSAGWQYSWVGRLQ